MKNSILTIALTTVTFLSIFASNTKLEKDYIVTEDGIVYADKVKVTNENILKAKFDNGESMTFATEDVKAYRKNGKEYKRFYKVSEGSKFVSRIYMQKLYSRAGYDLYRYGKSFYVYSGEEQELKINKENYKVVLSFFFPKFNLLFSI
jgi:hypothetical protein